MKLVLCYTASDGYTYHCDITLPFEYESAEAAYVHLEEAIKEAFKEHHDFVFAGMRFQYDSFYDEGLLDMPKIFTLDGWFDHNKPIHKDVS